MLPPMKAEPFAISSCATTISYWRRSSSRWPATPCIRWRLDFVSMEGPDARACSISPFGQAAADAVDTSSWLVGWGWHSGNGARDSNGSSVHADCNHVPSEVDGAMEEGSPMVQRGGTQRYRSGALVFGGGHVVLPLLRLQLPDTDLAT